MAEKPTLAAPAGTVTLAGTVALVLLLVTPTTNPPARAALLNVTVHAETPPALTVAGAQESPLSVGCVGWGIVIIPPVPEVAIEVLPVKSVAITPEIWIGAELSNAPDAIVIVALATVPLAMTFSFIP